MGRGPKSRKASRPHSSADPPMDADTAVAPSEVAAVPGAEADRDEDEDDEEDEDEEDEEEEEEAAPEAVLVAPIRQLSTSSLPFGSRLSNPLRSSSLRGVSSLVAPTFIASTASRSALGHRSLSAMPRTHR